MAYYNIAYQIEVGDGQQYPFKSHAGTIGLRAVSNKHALNKALKYAMKLPLFVAYDVEGQRTSAEVKILEGPL